MSGRRIISAAALILAAYAVGEAACLAMRAAWWLMAVPVALIAGVPIPSI